MIDSFRCDAIASPSFGSLLMLPAAGEVDHGVLRAGVAGEPPL